MIEGRLFELDYDQMCRRGIYSSYNVIKRVGGAFIRVLVLLLLLSIILIIISTQFAFYTHSGTHTDLLWHLNDFTINTYSVASCVWK